MTRRQWSGVFMIACLIYLFNTPQVQSVLSLPQKVEVPEGAAIHLSLTVPATVISDPALTAAGDHSGFMVRTSALGKYFLHLKAFGIVPLRKIEVDSVQPIRVIPGGDSIGISVQAQGPLVVSRSRVVDEHGQAVYPTANQDVRLGDVILAINGKKIHSDHEVSEIVDKAGKKKEQVELLLLRDKRQQIKVRISPVFDRDLGRYRLGLYIRDGISGVGTLTMVNPKNGRYVALGHLVADQATGRPFPLWFGHIGHAKIIGIHPGRSGKPGEKVGVLATDLTLAGDVDRNAELGIAGTLKSGLRSVPLLPLASFSQVHKGKAQLLTVVHGHKIEHFRIRILRIFKQDRPSTKGMIIKVTDPQLVKQTGGIVQGMSGSPIVQDGRLIGAITHVFVSDPTKGYAVYAEWMAQSLGLLHAPDPKMAAKGSIPG